MLIPEDPWYVITLLQITLDLVHRAETAGFKALCVSVDMPVSGIRLNELRNNFRPPQDVAILNQGLPTKKQQCCCSILEGSYTWEDIKWLKTQTSLKLVLKGILRADDALTALEVGVDGILVSNHGARQLDGVPATIDVLASVVEAVRGRCEVYMDGGVTEGTNVLKALALGARAVFVGRPNLYALAVGGKEGVKKMLKILREELDTAMALTGCCDVMQVPRDIVLGPQR